MKSAKSEDDLNVRTSWSKYSIRCNHFSSSYRYLSKDSRILQRKELFILFPLRTKFVPVVRNWHLHKVTINQNSNTSHKCPNDNGVLGNPSNECDQLVIYRMASMNEIKWAYHIGDGQLANSFAEMTGSKLVMVISSSKYYRIIHPTSSFSKVINYYIAHTQRIKSTRLMEPYEY